MKMIHLSDLHIGKKINEFPMLEDQRYILKEILEIIDDERPDAVLIAGDIYDKPIPSAEAVELFDEFLVSLAKRHQETFIIAGNHDSAERLAFGNRLIDASGIHISPVYDGSVKSVCLQDEYGEVCIYMLPFIKPVHVKRFFPEKEIASYTDALAAAIEAMQIDKTKRNVILAHQFVTGALRSDSEEVSVGGLDNVDASVFADFDYTALGHIHGPQNISSEKIRYCGTPLKYSFSEKDHQKSVSVLELKEKGDLTLRCVPLHPLHDMKEVRGSFAELIGNERSEDYMHVILTDEEDVPDALNDLRKVYPNLMRLDYDNTRTRHQAILDNIEDLEDKTPEELFEEFYEKQNGTALNEAQRKYLAEMIEAVWEEER